MKKKTSTITGGALAAAALGALAAAPPPAPPSGAVRGFTELGLKLHAELTRRRAEPNVVLAPASVAFALSMAANGAGGATREGILRALGAPGIGLDELNAASGALLRELPGADPAVRIDVANSLWARRGVPFKEPFLEVNRAHYRAEVRLLDFRDPGAVATINGWVGRATQGKIPAILDRIRPEDVMFLLNAVYFKGTWTARFDPALTRDGPFTTGVGAEVRVPMMTQAGRFPCFEKDGLKAVSLPYGKRRFAMHVFLPPRGSSPAALLQSITPEGWEAWMGSFRPRQGSVSLPRFKVEYAAELNEPLAALGMDAALDPARADFRGILDEGAHITQVRHRTFIEVNEEGTEAAGATSVGVGVTSLEAEPFLMVVDRPFLLAVRDGETGTLLFLGSIADPR